MNKDINNMALLPIYKQRLTNRIAELELQLKNAKEEWDSLTLLEDEMTTSKKLSMEAPIEELELTVRSYNCLKRAGILTIEQLSLFTKAELSKVQHLGNRGTKEILEKLAESGIHLSKE